MMSIILYLRIVVGVISSIPPLVLYARSRHVRGSSNPLRQRGRWGGHCIEPRRAGLVPHRGTDGSDSRSKRGCAILPFDIIQLQIVIPLRRGFCKSESFAVYVAVNTVSCNGDMQLVVNSSTVYFCPRVRGRSMVVTLLSERTRRRRAGVLRMGFIPYKDLEEAALARSLENNVLNCHLESRISNLFNSPPRVIVVRNGDPV
jgi:hypothetical protein